MKIRILAIQEPRGVVAVVDSADVVLKEWVLWTFWAWSSMEEQ